MKLKSVKGKAKWEKLSIVYKRPDSESLLQLISLVIPLPSGHALASPQPTPRPFWEKTPQVSPGDRQVPDQLCNREERAASLQPLSPEAVRGCSHKQLLLCKMTKATLRGSGNTAIFTKFHFNEFLSYLHSFDLF